MNFGNSMDKISETRETAKQSDAYFGIDKRISLDETKPRKSKDVDIDRRKDISVKEPGAEMQENRAEDKTSVQNEDISRKEAAEEAVPKVVENKKNGIEREEIVQRELEEKYPAEKGFTVKREAELRDKNGKIVIDPETKTYRRLDFAVVNKESNKVIGTYEVTSQNADKKKQTEKEERILDLGGRYIRVDGKLYELPVNLKTEIVRKD